MRKEKEKQESSKASIIPIAKILENKFDPKACIISN